MMILMRTIFWAGKYIAFKNIKILFTCLLSGVVDIKTVYDGSIDHWIVLDGVKHGKIHLRFTWMSLTADYASLDKVRLLCSLKGIT